MTKMIYDENDLILKLEEILMHDNLYNHIKERDTLKKELFHPEFISILEKDLHRWYSVAEAGRIVGVEKPIPPSTLKHYIDNLREYILPEDAPTNKYIRLNYLSLVKLRMVWLLKDELKMSGLKTEVGILGTVVNNQNTNPFPVSNDYEFKQYYAMTQFLFNTLMEIGEDGQPRMKQNIHQLLKAAPNLLEGPTKVMKELEEQREIINQLSEQNNRLNEENKQLKKQLDSMIGETEELRSQIIELPEQINQNTEDVKKDIEQQQNEKLEALIRQLKARKQAEQEWEQKGAFTRAFGKRSEFVEKRIQEILSSYDNQSE